MQVQENFETYSREIDLKHFEHYVLSGRLLRLTLTNFLLGIPFSRIHHGGKNAHRGNMSQNATRSSLRAHCIEGRQGVTGYFCSSFSPRVIDATRLCMNVIQFYPQNFCSINILNMAGFFIAHSRIVFKIKPD